MIEAIGIVLTLIVIVSVLMANSSNSLLAYYSLLPAISAFGSTGGLTSDSLGQGVMYVQNANSNSISVVDLATNTILRNITVDGTLHNVKLSEDQQTLYIITTARGSGTIFMLNTTSNELMNEKISTEVS